MIIFSASFSPLSPLRQRQAFADYYWYAIFAIEPRWLRHFHAAAIDYGWLLFIIIFADIAGWCH
jgi:hypothetical protein